MGPLKLTPQNNKELGIYRCPLVRRGAAGMQTLVFDNGTSRDTERGFARITPVSNPVGRATSCDVKIEQQLRICLGISDARPSIDHDMARISRIYQAQR